MYAVFAGIECELLSGASLSSMHLFICCCLVVQLSLTFCDPPTPTPTLAMEPTRLLCPWNFPGKNTGLGSHFLLQEIFPSPALTGGVFTTGPPGKPYLLTQPSQLLLEPGKWGY